MGPCLWGENQAAPVARGLHAEGANQVNESVKEGILIAVTQWRIKAEEARLLAATLPVTTRKLSTKEMLEDMAKCYDSLADKVEIFIESKEG